jgi:hypothetical protein
MKPEKVLCLAALLSVGAAVDVHSLRKGPESASWNAYNLYGIPSGSTESTNGEAATLAIPIPINDIEYVSFLTTSTDPNVLGDLSGKMIRATISISAIGVPEFIFNFEGSSWDTCPAQANVRLYFTTTGGMYDLDDANTNETQYWWADVAGTNLDVGLDTTLTASLLDPSQWLDSQGNPGSNPQYTAAFFEAVQNVRQIGLAFGGGCFYDVGVGVAEDSGSAEFHLINYTVY